MKTVTVAQDYDAELERVLELFTDPQVFLAMEGLTRVAPVAEISRTERGDVVEMVMRYKFVAPLSSAVTAVVDRDKITWVQTHVIDRAARTETIAFVLDHYRNMLDFRGGTARYERLGDERTRRTVSGSFGVKSIPFFVRGAVENAIVSGLEDHYQQEHDRIVQRLDS